MNVREWQKPPNYAAICKAIPAVKENKHIVFTHGNDLYVPGGGDISTDLMRHEETHERQQLAMGVDEWWARYLADEQFRFDQELAAYREQYKVIRTYERRRAEYFLNYITKDLSGAMYGHLCSRSKARKLITK